MARIDVENPSEYENPLDTQFCLTDAAVPDATITLPANRLLASYLVEDVVLTPGEIQYASNQSLSVRGLLYMDQDIFTNQTLSSKKLGYIEWGRGRVYTAEAIAKNTLFVSAGLGRIRAYDPPATGGTDTGPMILGRTKCGATAVDDIVDVMFSSFYNGV